MYFLKRLKEVGMKRCLVLLFLALSFALSANSVFSTYGFPDYYLGHDVYSLGMGEVGNSDLYRVNTSYGNPSLAVTSKLVAFSSTMSFGYMTYSDDIDQSYNDDGLYFPQFNVTVPVGRHRFAFNFNTVSSGNLENQGDITMTGSMGDSILTGTEINKLQSNIFKTEMIWAWETDWVNIGVGAGFYWGQRIQQHQILFNSNAYADTKNEKSEFFSDPCFTFGLSRDFGKFSLGGTYSPKIKAGGDAEMVSTFNTIPLGEISNEIPGLASLSGTWAFVPNWKTAIDLHYDFSGDINSDRSLEDGWRVGLGVAYDPVHGFGSYLEQIPVRAGVFMRKLPFKANDETVYEKGASLGFSIPFDKNSRSISFSMKYMLRGDASENLVEDEVMLFSVGTVGFDLFSKILRRTAPRDIPKPAKGF